MHEDSRLLLQLDQEGERSLDGSAEGGQNYVVAITRRRARQDVLALKNQNNENERAT
jgi:hypothetical protein